MLQSGEVRRWEVPSVTAARVGLFVMAAEPQPSSSTWPCCISFAWGHRRAKQLMGRAMEVDADSGCSSISFLYNNHHLYFPSSVGNIEY